MKRIVTVFLAVVMTGMAASVMAAPRTVFFEHFSQEMCSTCPITAAAITQFRADYGYEDVAIISYWTQGSQALPDANNRAMEFYDEVLTPSVVCDGVYDVPEPPQEYADFVAAYNAYSGSSSPCSMSVLDCGGGNYTIHIEAESAFSGSLIVVAYEEYTDSHGATYACFGRQFVTPYSGESISATAGQTLDIPKTVTVGHSGVVAWIHDNAKADGGSRRFTPWAVLQSADSHAGGTPSTPTPTPTGSDTPTPTTPPGTPTATPAIPCDDIGCTIDMPSDYFRGGDPFYLNIYLCNIDAVQYEVPLFVILDVAGALFFAPSFTAFDKYDVILPPNEQILQVVLPEFNWPSNVGTASGLKFYAGMTNSQMSQLFGDLDMATFGWGN
ncbi:hypothetical protein JXA80_12120 [bacterium]|nr:hypothetical protein [candidate division CSSED10-310 bacterium]